MTSVHLHCCAPGAPREGTAAAAELIAAEAPRRRARPAAAQAGAAAAFLDAEAECSEDKSGAFLNQHFSGCSFAQP